MTLSLTAEMIQWLGRMPEQFDESESLLAFSTGQDVHHDCRCTRMSIRCVHLVFAFCQRVARCRHTSLHTLISPEDSTARLNPQQSPHNSPSANQASVGSLTLIHDPAPKQFPRSLRPHISQVSRLLCPVQSIPSLWKRDVREYTVSPPPSGKDCIPDQRAAPTKVLPASVLVRDERDVGAGVDFQHD